MTARRPQSKRSEQLPLPSALLTFTTCTSAAKEYHRLLTDFLLCFYKCLASSFVGEKHVSPLNVAGCPFRTSTLTSLKMMFTSRPWLLFSGAVSRGDGCVCAAVRRRTGVPGRGARQLVLSSTVGRLRH